MNSIAPVRRRRRSKPWFSKTRRKRGTGLGWWMLWVATGYFKAKAEGRKFNPYGPPQRKPRTVRPKATGGTGGGGSRPGRPVDRPGTERPAPKKPKDDAITPIDEGYDPNYKGPGHDDPIDDAEIVDPSDEEYVVDGEVIDDEDDEEEFPLVDEDGNGPREITDNYSWIE